ncbi:MAG: hypothetical protein LBQ24_00030 [Candidatus Peribacteria bacterium]|jgi:hypothetical protein|nr:hypothetical protein [Candidatus Peribacteria bacterium]
MSNIFVQITKKIESGEEISPLLFVGKNLEIVNSEVENLAKSLLKKFDIPTAYFYVLMDK